MDVFAIRGSQYRLTCNFLKLVPLRQLCLDAVTCYLDLYCKPEGQQLRPFENLPTSLMSDLLSLLEKKKLLNARYLPSLIGHNVNILKLSSEQISLPYGDRMDHILALIKQKCKTSLQKLSLFYISLSQQEIKDTLSCLKNIRVLDLSIHGIDDDVLAVIGANIIELREIELSLCTQVTKQGIMNLCANDGRLGKCKQLVHLDIYGTSVNTEGVALALSNLPNLKRLFHEDLHEAIIMFNRDNPEQSLNLRELRVVNNTSNYLEKILDICPKIQVVKFENHSENSSDFLDVSSLLNLSTCQMNELSIQYFCFEISVLNSVLKHHGPSLIQLAFKDCGNVQLDLSIIALLCSNIECLDVTDCRLVNDSQHSFKNKFLSLKHFVLECPTHPTNNTSLTGQELKYILMSKTLESIKIVKLESFSDNVLNFVLTEARQNHDVFSKLRIFTIESCENITAQHLFSLVCLAQNLTLFEISTSSNVFQNMTGFISLISKHNLRIEMQ